MSDFERIAAIIRFLETYQTQQPTLAELAAICGLSESHFHRLFHRWAGVTPKDFLQCLTAEHAKSRLRASAGVLETALEVGLSGPSRLHDLLVTLEAASPGEIKSGGKGMDIHWGFTESPFGWCQLGWAHRGICHLSFHETRAAPEAQTELQLHIRWPQATFNRDDQEAQRLGCSIFQTQNTSPIPLKTFVRATPFQLKVWQALLRIPAGNLVSYGKIATSIGATKATRAVGTACGSNPIAYLIPCHRVIRETGAVQGYRWGSTRKQALLAWEFSRHPQTLPTFPALI